VKHSWDCGGTTGIFLSVNSSTIVVIRGKRACFWGSIYLDVFGEEDRELKYVSAEAGFKSIYTI
jgi:E3 ubiquitin-protein ligase UBR3